MTTDLEKLRIGARGLLLNERSHTPERIREAIKSYRAVAPSVTDAEAENLAREFESIHQVSMDFGSVLVEQDDKFEKWLEEAKSSIDDYYWKRYELLLGERDFSVQVISKIDHLTDQVLGLLGNPNLEGPWDRRGMVVGHVQSGKTANYTGLVCKAADAGYRVIFVIAGIHNNLRDQTQARLDEGFVGLDTAKRGQISKRLIGVGKIDQKRRPCPITSRIHDFNKNMATSLGLELTHLNEPVLLVIKKNSSTLKNLLEWLKENNAGAGNRKIATPMLLIDDEADNASINIKKGDNEVSRINGQIRELLNAFERKSYVGYTATPFANIFVDPDSDDEMYGQDLFPKDFIIGLDPPDNYFGPSQVFRYSGDNGGGPVIVFPIHDNEDLLPLKHRIKHKISEIPDSMLEAIRAFIIVRAVRLVRGHKNEHNSMLVNASRFTGVQSKIRNEIHRQVRQIRESVRINYRESEEKATQDHEMKALRKVYLDRFPNIEETWGQIQDCLWESISPIKVVEINSCSPDSLDYDDRKNGLNVIAVGGFSLSRGLTLRGLSISYFLRNSMFYDTLMQMGRWFGYRPGYEDLCRIWMPEEAEGWYSHIAESIEELREEFRRMMEINATPKEFGLKVRGHPDTLYVTARNKMQAGKAITVKIGLANRFVETTVLYPDKATNDINRQAAKSLADKIRPLKVKLTGNLSSKLFRRVPDSDILEFLEAFKNHKASLRSDTTPIRDYIKEAKLKDWDVYFPGLNKSEQKFLDKSMGFEIYCQSRKRGKRTDGLHIGNKERVSSRGVEAVGLTEKEISIAKAEYREQSNKTNEENVNYPDRVFRWKRKYPLLIIHLLTIKNGVEQQVGGNPFIAWSISFPRAKKEEIKVVYHVNTTWMKERYREEAEEDEAGGDDE